jgi:hypothetical protein
MEHFKNHHYCMKTPESKAEAAIKEYFEGVSPERIHLITYKLKKDNIAIWDTAGSGKFDPFFHNVQFPYRKARSSAFHEFGHVVDLIHAEMYRKQISRNGWKTIYKSRYYSEEYICSTGKTLHQTVKEEVSSQAQTLYGMLMNAFKQEVLATFPENIAKEYLLRYEMATTERTLSSKYQHSKNRESAEMQAVHQEQMRLSEILHANKYFDSTWKVVQKSIAYKEFDSKYEVLTDMLSGFINITYLLSGHSPSYMKKGGFGNEFFAEMFSAETENREDCLAITEQYLPQSCTAYRELLAKVSADAHKE